MALKMPAAAPTSLAVWVRALGLCWVLKLPRDFCESEVNVAQTCLTLCDPMDCSLLHSSVMEFSRQEYWSGLPFPSPGNLPDTGRNQTGVCCIADGLFAS